MFNMAGNNLLTVATKYAKDKERAVNKQRMSIVKSSDGVFVIFKGEYDPETGNSLPSKVFFTTTIQEVTDTITELQDEIVKLTTFSETLVGII